MVAEGLFIVNEIIVLCYLSHANHVVGSTFQYKGSCCCVNKAELCRLQHDSQRVPRSLMISDCCNEQIYLLLNVIIRILQMGSCVNVRRHTHTGNRLISRQ